MFFLRRAAAAGHVRVGTDEERKTLDELIEKKLVIGNQLTDAGWTELRKSRGSLQALIPFALHLVDQKPIDSGDCHKSAPNEAVLFHRSLSVGTCDLRRQPVLQSLFVCIRECVDYRGLAKLLVENFSVSIEMRFQEVVGHLN